MTKVNLSELIRNTQAQTFAPVPVGNHNATLESMDFKFSSNGNPTFNAAFVIDEGEPFAGRKLWRNITITENSVAVAVAQMAVLGVDQETLAHALEEDDPSVVCKMVLDVKVTLKVKHREWNNEVRADVERILPRKDVDANVVPISGSATVTARPARPF